MKVPANMGEIGFVACGCSAGPAPRYSPRVAGLVSRIANPLGLVLWLLSGQALKADSQSVRMPQKSGI